MKEVNYTLQRLAVELDTGDVPSTVCRVHDVPRLKRTARSLRLRAEGLEKVATAMLDQPPPVHPHFDGDPLTPPSSPKQSRSLLPNQQNSDHPYSLPNGVRVRLTLGTIINDLFARQAPPPPYRHHHHQPVPIFVSGNSSDLASSRGNSPVIPKNMSIPLSQIPPIDSLPASVFLALPPAVIPLSTISAGLQTYPWRVSTS